MSLSSLGLWPKIMCLMGKGKWEVEKSEKHEKSYGESRKIGETGESYGVSRKIRERHGFPTYLIIFW